MSDDDRGVSEVVGFVLVFGVIIASVALLSVVGFQAMDDYQEIEQLQNAERGMEALADNFNDIARYDAINLRSGELALRQGTVTTGGESTNVTVTITHEDGTTQTPIDDESLGALEYSVGSDTISYEGGGVFRSEGAGGSVAVSEPRISCAGDTGIVSLVVIEPEAVSRQTSESVEFTATENRSAKISESGSEVEIEFDSPRHERAWNSVFEDDWDGSEGEFACDAEQVLVQIVFVEIDY